MGSTELSIDTIAHISKFVQFADFDNLLMAFKKEDAEMVKRAYLYRNFTFFDTDSLTCRPISYLQSWMEVNHDWKDMYDNPREHGMCTWNDKIQFNWLFKDILRAVRFAPLEVVQYLIESSFFDFCIDENYLIHSEYLLQGYPTFCPPIVLVYNRSLHTMQDFPFKTKLSLLHFAMWETSCDLDKFRLLLSHKDINLNQENYSGHTALHYACRFNPNKITFMKACLLMEAGVDINDHAVDGGTFQDWMRSFSTGTLDEETKIAFTELKKLVFHSLRPKYWRLLKDFLLDTGYSVGTILNKLKEKLSSHI